MHLLIKKKKRGTNNSALLKLSRESKRNIKDTGSYVPIDRATKKRQSRRKNRREG